jgi:hypothetical protein
MDPRKRGPGKPVPPKSVPAHPKKPAGSAALTVKRPTAATSAAPEPPAKQPPAPSRTGCTILLIVGLVLAMSLTAGLAVGLVLLLRWQGGASEPALASLRDVQHNWWNAEGLGATGSQDPGSALERLLDKQREWWDNEHLAKDANTDSTDSLARLEKQQREWWDKEGLQSGQAHKDTPAALARLETIDQQWWKAEHLTRVSGSAAGSPEGSSGGDGPAQVDAGPDPKVTFAEKESTRRFLDAGGSVQSEEAVELGLRWLAAQQHDDGRWSLRAAPGSKSNLAGRPARVAAKGGEDVAATAFGLLPFLARGETHKGSEETHTYTKPVERGIHFLMAEQKPDGDLRGGGNMYTHALATIALCEDFGMTSDPVLREPCEKAIKFLVNAQDKKGGGWRYAPGSPGDLSVTAWVLQALKSGQMAGMTVPRETLTGASKFLDSVALPNDSGYGYMARQPGHWEPAPATMTAAGILCRQYLQGNQKPKSVATKAALDRITAAPPSPALRNMYYYYYATFTLFNVGDEHWSQWNPKMRELLIGSQARGSDLTLKGSWEPQGKQFQNYGGRLMTTSLALLTLEVYYRHLPLNRVEIGSAAKNLDHKQPKK